MAHHVIRAGRAASGRNDVRCTISIGGFVPKPHTPFQWAAQAHPDVVDDRLRKLREAVNADRKLGRNVGMRYHDGQPSLIEGLLARGDRRVGRVIERVWREGGRFDGWSEHFSYERWIDAGAAELEPLGVSLDWFTTRERDRDEVLPWDHLDSGLERDWLWDDWQDALAGREQDDCRWTPCFDCGVCPSTGTDIEVGPSGTTLLPLTVVNTRPADRRTPTGWLSRTSSSGSPTSATWPPSPGCAAPGWRNAPGVRSTTRVSRPRSRSGGASSCRGGRSGWPRPGRSAAAGRPVGSINVVEIVHMPRPGSRGGRIGHVGNAFVLSAVRRPRVSRGRCWPARSQHARERRYRRLVLAPTGSSASFYLRAGFVPAGESLLVLDPMALPDPRSGTGHRVAGPA